MLSLLAQARLPDAECSVALWSDSSDCGVLCWELLKTSMVQVDL